MATRWHTHPSSPSQGCCLQTFVHFLVLFLNYTRRGISIVSGPRALAENCPPLYLLSHARREALTAPLAPTGLLQHGAPTARPVLASTSRLVLV